MKYLILISCLHLGLAVANSQVVYTSTWVAKTKQQPNAQLRLSTSVIEERYLVEAGKRLLELTLDLTYSNRGSEFILLDKDSVLVLRKVISRDLKAASHKKYEYDEYSALLDADYMRARGMHLDGSPEEESFVRVKPGDSVTLQEVIRLRLDGTEGEKNLLHSGTHFLQVKVATWYYRDNPEPYREKWHEQGYLWAENILSAPMPVTVKPGY